MAMLAEAGRRAARIRRGARVAAFSGWTSGLFAALTLLTGLTDVVSVAVGAGLAAVAFNEFRGAAMLRRFDSRAGARLAIGQGVLGILIVAYAAIGIVRALGGAGAASGDAQVDAVLAETGLDGLVRSITVAIYAAVAGVGVVVPGLTAWYYASRGRHLRAFVERTPAWIVRMLAETS